MDDVKERLVRALLASERTAAEDLLSSLAAKATPMEIAERVITPALEDIGDMWEAGRVSMSQIYMGAASARITWTAYCRASARCASRSPPWP